MKQIRHTLLAIILPFTTACAVFAQAGATDLTFDPGSGANGAILGLALQPDGKVIAVGNFTEFDGISRSHIVRLNSDGSVDPTFDPIIDGTRIDAVALRNEKIVITGDFSTVDGETHLGVARLNLDGSVDSTFNGSRNGNSVGILSDDKVVLGGVGGLTHRGIIRFFPNGDVDEAFALSVDRPLGQVYAVAIQPDDKALFAGSFIAVNGESRLRIARANVDGTLDPTFVPAGGSIFEVNALAVGPDGRIYPGGYLLSRLNSDGSLDPTFQSSTFNGGATLVTDIALQADGKLVIGGNFTSIQDIVTGAGTNRNYVARLNPDGTVDETFGHGQSLADNRVQAVAVQPDGRILIAGLFATVNGVPRSGIARLLGDAPVDEPVLTSERIKGGKIILRWPAIYSDWILQGTKNPRRDNWKTVDIVPQVVDGTNTVISRIGANGKFYRLVPE